MILLSEGKLKYNPDRKLKLGRYIVKRRKGLVKWVGSKDKD